MRFLGQPLPEPAGNGTGSQWGSYEFGGPFRSEGAPAPNRLGSWAAIGSGVRASACPVHHRRQRQAVLPGPGGNRGRRLSGPRQRPLGMSHFTRYRSWLHSGLRCSREGSVRSSAGAWAEPNSSSKCRQIAAQVSFVWNSCPH